jgi:hypothetical protein
MPPASNALTVYQKIDNPIAFANEFAEAAAAMCSCDIRQGKAMAMLALTEGINLMELSRRYHWIKGKPSMQSAAMLAEFRMNHGGKFKVTERTEKATRITFTDKDGEVYNCELTNEQAMASRWPWKDWKKKDEGLKDNWATPLDQKTMLFARCVSDSLRFICPELTAGVYTPEEIIDLGDGDAPKRQAAPTVTQVITELAEAGGDGKVSTAVAAADGDDADEAEWTVAGGSPDAAKAEPDKMVDGAAAIDPASPGSITRQQLDEINALMAKIFPADQLTTIRDAALAKRNVQSFHNLSKTQGDEMVGKLRDQDRFQASAKN